MLFFFDGDIMKNYYYRLVYIFSIIELFFIAIFSIMMFKFFRVNTSDIIKIICGFVFLVFLFDIINLGFTTNNFCAWSIIICKKQYFRAYVKNA